MPFSVRQSPSLDSLKRILKTHYFANNSDNLATASSVSNSTFSIKCALQIAMNE